jgi:urea carboxylase
MFKKVLIANRGEIACRIQRTLRRLGVADVAVYADPDRHAPHVLGASEAYSLGGSRVADSYLRIERLLEIARESGAEAVHPGYGLLSENAEFAEACEAAGIAFVGPRPEHLRQFGLKHTARSLAESAQVPMLTGTGLVHSVEEAMAAAETMGFPVMLKSTAGGGGIGMRVCRGVDELAAQYRSVLELSEKNFGSSGLFLERYVERARHLEVQIFGDGAGRVVALGERDCSVQRRHQKVIEETPAPDLPEKVRSALIDSAVRLGESVNYASAGTVEYIYDAQRAEFAFLEVNTRLQVEHGVTELVTGVDLVEWMLRLAAGEIPDFSKIPSTPRGHAIQTRVYAEDPVKDFTPSSGLITDCRFPANCRVDHWIEPGQEVSPFYDPLLAKVMVHGTDRADSLNRLSIALGETEVHGIETNLDFLRQIVVSEAFATGRVATDLLKSMPPVARTVEVLDGGMQTTLQDYPGRVGYWDVGVPPSGPMDALSFRLGNRLLANPDDAVGLECTLSGPTLRFWAETTICLTGAQCDATLDGEPIPFYQTVTVKPGMLLRLGAMSDAGQRCYLLFAGGLDAPHYLGSRATFVLGQFGGHAGRALRTGDMLRLSPSRTQPPVCALPEADRPVLSHDWSLRVLYGPHGAPDFFTEGDIETFFAAEWKVHFNSARTGVRLIGPKPEWAREDGGEAGLHPSNIHDNAYAVGTVDFTGDMPVILGPDGPSLGGFVCPATVIKADLWKLGQLKPGDRVHFVSVSRDFAEAEERRQEAWIEERRQPLIPELKGGGESSPILATLSPEEHPLGVIYRQAGEDYLLVEYGELILDLNLRARVHALMQALAEQAIPGVIEMTPGIRSLQIHFDNQRLPVNRLLDHLLGLEQEIPDASALRFPTRIVRLPLSWDDEATRLAIQKYTQAVRKDAPWCPSNIEFIRRINGLDSIEAVKEIVFSARYLVLGLGDVYLGAPVATPIDPRHRLVTTKYNPARTWTPENAVGIGGAYLCVYGMEGPGGYQFVGRTVQMWNRYRSTSDFAPGKPWLLRFFDQIQFYEVSHEELSRMREDFPWGRCPLEVEEGEFDLGAYNRFQTENRASIETFKARQQASFEAERARWARMEEVTPVETPEVEAPEEFAPDTVFASAPMPGSVWKILAAPGDRVEAGQTVAILESMKMEVPVTVFSAGVVDRVLTTEGAAVEGGQRLLSIVP